MNARGKIYTGTLNLVSLSIIRKIVMYLKVSLDVSFLSSMSRLIVPLFRDISLGNNMCFKGNCHSRFLKSLIICKPRCLKVGKSIIDELLYGHS